MGKETTQAHKEVPFILLKHARHRCRGHGPSYQVYCAVLTFQTQLPLPPGDSRRKDFHSTCVSLLNFPSNTLSPSMVHLSAARNKG